MHEASTVARHHRHVVLEREVAVGATAGAQYISRLLGDAERQASLSAAKRQVACISYGSNYSIEIHI